VAISTCSYELQRFRDGIGGPRSVIFSLESQEKRSDES